VLDIGIDLYEPEFAFQNVQEKGKGTGFALKGGARVNINTGENFGLFLEGRYAYQVVHKLSGPGISTADFKTETWHAEWGIKGKLEEREWGTIYYVWPSNYWLKEHKDLKIRDFKLDLSGFQVSIGIFYRF